METELRETIAKLQRQLSEAQADIERLTLDVQILTEELERERRPRMDER